MATCLSQHRQSHCAGRAGLAAALPQRCFSASRLTICPGLHQFVLRCDNKHSYGLKYFLCYSVLLFANQKSLFLITGVLSFTLWRILVFHKTVQFQTGMRILLTILWACLFHSCQVYFIVTKFRPHFQNLLVAETVWHCNSFTILNIHFFLHPKSQVIHLERNKLGLTYFVLINKTWQFLIIFIYLSTNCFTFFGRY